MPRVSCFQLISGHFPFSSPFQKMVMVALKCRSVLRHQKDYPSTHTMTRSVWIKLLIMLSALHIKYSYKSNNYDLRETVIRLSLSSAQKRHSSGRANDQNAIDSNGWLFSFPNPREQQNNKIKNNTLNKWVEMNFHENVRFHWFDNDKSWEVKWLRISLGVCLISEIVQQ